MIPTAPILALLLALPPNWHDRAETGYADRQAVIAEAIAHASDSREDAAALVTLAQFESGRRRAVHSGEIRGGLGEGLWQLEPGSNRKPPFSGLSEWCTTHAAGEALWLWHHSGQCGSSPAAHFAAYAGSCKFAQAAKRQAFYYWTLSRI